MNKYSFYPVLIDVDLGTEPQKSAESLKLLQSFTIPLDVQGMDTIEGAGFVAMMQPIFFRVKRPGCRFTIQPKMVKATDAEKFVIACLLKGTYFSCASKKTKDELIKMHEDKLIRKIDYARVVRSVFYNTVVVKDASEYNLLAEIGEEEEGKAWMDARKSYKEVITLSKARKAKKEGVKTTSKNRLMIENEYLSIHKKDK